MNLLKKPHLLPVFAAGTGAFALVLRKMLYAFAIDEKGLLVAGHPVELALLGLSGVVLTILAAWVWKLDGSREYAHNFGPSRAAFAGHLAAAVGILVTILTTVPQMDGYLGWFWWILGALSPACLVLAGQKRTAGKQPGFGLHLLPTLFYVLHIINQYQTWCANPQLLDDIFAIFGSICLMFFSLYTTCFDADAGSRRRQLLFGLWSIYLLTAELAASGYPWMYLGGILWAMTDLCTFYPQPKPEQEAVHEG